MAFASDDLPLLDRRAPAAPSASDDTEAQLVEADVAPPRLDEPPTVGNTLEDYFSFQEIFRRVLASAKEELERSSALLFWSGLAAGLSLGLTFLARVVATDAAGDGGSALVGNLLYPVGFILIVLGRYQLFTENTLTPVTLVLTGLAKLKNLARLWAIVLFGNLAGAVLVATLLAWTDVFEAEAGIVAIELGRHALDVELLTVLARAVIAGWIVASMVWLVHGALDTLSRLLIVWILMFLVGVADLFHVVTATVEVVYVVLVDAASSWADVPLFFGTVLLGNIVGGVVFVAVLNTTQFGREADGLIAEHLRQTHGDELAEAEAG